MQGLHRTNNISEGWHCRFNILVGKSHPDLYSFLNVIQKEQGDVDKMLVELGLGRSICPKKRRKYVGLQDRLRYITAEYSTYKEEGRILEFLSNIGSNIALE